MPTAVCSGILSIKACVKAAIALKAVILAYMILVRMAADRYANQCPQKAAENDRPHNPRSPLVLGERKESDAVIQGA